MKEAEAKELALVVGVVAGFIAYKAQGEPPACVINGVPVPGSTQTLLDAVRGAATHPAEDASLGIAAILDKVTEYETAGVVTPDLAAKVYSWWEGLTPAQQQAVQAAEDGGGLSCAAGATGSQILSGASAFTAAVVVGGLAYLGAHLLLSEGE